MKILELRPPKDPHEEIAELEKHINEILRQEIYLPLIAELKEHQNVVLNSLEDLIEVIRTGRIRFYRGKFKGRFSSLISKELIKLGGKWDSKQGCFAIPYSKLTPDVKTAIDVAESRFQKTADRINEQISRISPAEIAEKLKLENIFDTALWKVDNDFKKAVQGIIVPPQLTPERRRKIASEYTNNMKLDIKGWVEKEIVRLRKRIEPKVFQGNRYEGMIKGIQTSYGVSRNKAKFWARQETKLLITTYKEARYKDAGINAYKWRCVVGSELHPVRTQHRKLNDMSAKGHIFHYDDPPRVTEDGAFPVRYANPGRDFNCRCVSIPVIVFGDNK